ncbi:MAG: glycosyltransferase, partial [candidate division NC10 bacterium]|nr:glycosyltransferase [candidate division NC10 bacterium]
MRLGASAILIFWLVAGWITLRGTRRLARLSIAPPAGVRSAVSVIVPARNEARVLPRSIASLVGQTFPDLEVIALNDRSTDDTGAVLDSLKQIHARLTVIHLDSLPEGWVGKTHALYLGSRRAQGEWLLFTDADVIFHPQCLEAAVAWAEANRVDHLVVIPRVETVGFWEKVLVSCFSLLFSLAQRPWRVSDSRSRASIGIGAFNLIRRSAYEAIGTHRALANAVVDDLELGRLGKRHGLRQAVVRGEHLLSVRWQVGLSGVISGLEKNAFAGVEYS